MFNVLGCSHFSTKDTLFTLKLHCKSVVLYSCIKILSGSIHFFSCITTLILSLLDSSLISVIHSIFLSTTSSQIFATKVDLLTMYGISVITIFFHDFNSSTLCFPLHTIPPLPFSYTSLILFES